MLYLEAAAVVLLVGAAVFAAVMFWSRRDEAPDTAPGAGTWRATHYDVDGATRVVVRKVSATGVNVLNEHVVATLRPDDPEYDEKFLLAMNTARERRALFEAEDA